VVTVEGVAQLRRNQPIAQLLFLPRGEGGSCEVMVTWDGCRTEFCRVVEETVIQFNSPLMVRLQHIERRLGLIPAPLTFPLTTAPYNCDVHCGQRVARAGMGDLQ